MSLVDRALARLGLQKVSNDIPQTPLPEITRNSSTWGWFFNGISGLPAVTEETLMRVSAVHACVNLISGAIAALPMHVFRRSPDGERDRLPNDDLWWLLNEQFTPRWSAAAGWEYLTRSVLLKGDGFAEIKRQGPKIVGIEPIHPDRVTVAAWPDGSRLVYAIAPEAGAKGDVRTLDQDDVLHIPGFGFDGFRGLSPLRYALNMTGSVALAAQEFSARFYANSARPDGLITTEQELKPEQADAIAEAWAAKYQGVDKAGKPAVLGRGASFSPISLSMEDAQLIATRQFQIEEIARVYGVPPFMIGHNEKTTSWGSGVEAMGIGFVRYTLGPHLNRFHTEINRKFFRTASRFAEFDTTELERADTKSMFDAFRVALGRAGEPGFMTQDEVRTRLNLKKLPGGDKLSTGATDAPEQDPEPAGA